MSRQYVSTNTPWEPKAGYARAVRINDTIYVSGTTATNEQGEIVSAGDPYAQTVKTIHNIQSALQQLEANLENVVRTRMFVTDIRQWESIGKAHGEYFGTIRPATSMVEVSQLIQPEMRVEMEAVAVIN